MNFERIIFHEAGHAFVEYLLRRNELTLLRLRIEYCAPISQSTVADLRELTPQDYLPELEGQTESEPAIERPSMLDLQIRLGGMLGESILDNEPDVAANLQRIANDEMFIENYVYRLNSDPNFPGMAGFELPVSESHFSTTGVQSAISGALAVLQKAKGAEKNLLLKKYVKDIKYSKEKIEMAFYYQAGKNSAYNKGFEASSQSATAVLKKSKSRSKSSGVSKPANREPASDGLLRPAPAAAVRNLNLCGVQESSTNSFTLSFANTISRLAKLK